MPAGLLIDYRGVWPRVAHSAFVAPGAHVVGDVTIGEESGVWFGVTIRGDDNHVRIGTRTNVQDGTVIHVTSDGNPTLIGDDVTIGHMAMLHACTVESGGFVGMKACLLDGVVVESGAMVAAGALVTPGKRVPSGELWGGAPAKKLRDLTVDERAYLPWSAAHYARRAAEYVARLGPAARVEASHALTST